MFPIQAIRAIRPLKTIGGSTPAPPPVQRTTATMIKCDEMIKCNENFKCVGA